jgi:phage shock protein E
MTTPTDFMLIDVRSPGEYAGGHLEGSINVPLDEFTRRITELVPDKATPIVLCCASGARSGAAAGWLQQQGYTQVSNGGGVGTLAMQLGRPVRRG